MQAALGQPAGVGEICVRSADTRTGLNRVVVGTDADGYYRTGDLGQWEGGGDGPAAQPRRLVVRDRAAFAVKLANGEFVSPGLLEALFEGQCPLVEACCIVANPGDDAILAVVVPAPGDHDSNFTGADTGTGTGAAGAAAVLAQMRSAAVAAGRVPYEVPTAVHLDVLWNVDNGCRLSNGKLNRAGIAARVASATAAAMPAGSHPAGMAPVASLDESVVRFLLAGTDEAAAAALPGVRPCDTLGMLGGDSICAARVAERLPRSVGAGAVVARPLRELRAILSGGGGGGGGSVQPGAGWAAQHEEGGASFWAGEVSRGTATGTGVRTDATANTDSTASITTANTANAGDTDATDATDDAIDAIDAADAAADTGCAGAEAGHGGGRAPQLAVLLTGATGFLGPHILAALARAPELAGATIYCLARPPLSRVRVPPASAARVVLLAGDLAAGDLGLRPADRRMLEAAGVDLVVHNGAAVDHLRPYGQLKAANVDAADALLRLVGGGGPGHAPAFCFVSSLSALAPGDEAEAIDATPAARVAALHGGYGKTKWVCEQRLARALAGHRVSSLGIARFGLIGPHPTTGEANTGDWLHLFMRAVVASGAVPEIEALRSAAVELLPVDTAAAALVSLATRTLLARAARPPREQSTVRQHCPWPFHKLHGPFSFFCSQFFRWRAGNGGQAPAHQRTNALMRGSRGPCVACLHAGLRGTAGAARRALGRACVWGAADVGRRAAEPPRAVQPAPGRRRARAGSVRAAALRRLAGARPQGERGHLLRTIPQQHHPCSVCARCPRKAWACAPAVLQCPPCSTHHPPRNTRLLGARCPRTKAHAPGGGRGGRARHVVDSNLQLA